MKKLLKALGIIIGILILLFIIAVIAIVGFVSPNRIKPLLISQTKTYMGRELIIDSDLSWTFFPNIGIKTGHMQINNPPRFQQKVFAEIQEADVSVRLMPLLHDKVKSDGIVLHGLKLFLIKNAQGEVNWLLSRTVNPASTTSMVTESKNPSISVMDLAIAGVNVSDGEVHWMDEQNKASAIINHFNFYAKDINFLEPFPITASFDFTNQNPVLQGHVKYNSDVSLNMAKQIFSLRSIALVASMQQGNKQYNMKMSGNAIADLNQQTLTWSDFHAESGALSLTGKINVSPAKTTANLEVHPVDLRAWLAKTGYDVTNLQVFKNVSGKMDIVSAESVSIQGQFNADEITANHVKLTQINLPIHFENNILTIAPLTANFYQGTLKTTATIKLETAVPQIAVQGTLANIQIGGLLDDLGSAKKKLKINGMGNVDIQITTAGLDEDTLVKNLNGTNKLTVANGTLEGVDLRYYIDLAKAFFAQRSPTATNTNKTEFANLTGTTTITNGVVQNNDLVVTSSLFTSKGKGQINLVTQRIDYQLDTLINQTSDMQNTGWADIAKVTIPVLVKGNLSDPSIQLDSGALSKSLANAFMQKTKDDLKNKVQKNLGGQGGELLKSFLGQ